MAHRIAGEHGKFVNHKSHIICNLDTDNFCSPEFLDLVFQYFSGKNPSFLGVDGFFSQISGHPVKYKDGVGGRLALRKEDFYNTHGYDEVFRKDGYGYDDSKFLRRIALHLLRMPEMIPMEILDAIPHSNQERVAFISDPKMIEDSMKILEGHNAHPTTTEKLLSILKLESILFNGSIVANKNGFGMGNILLGPEEKPVELGKLSKEFYQSLNPSSELSLRRVSSIVSEKISHLLD